MNKEYIFTAIKGNNTKILKYFTKNGNKFDKYDYLYAIKHKKLKSFKAMQTINISEFYAELYDASRGTKFAKVLQEKHPDDFVILIKNRQK